MSAGIVHLTVLGDLDAISFLITYPPLPWVLAAWAVAVILAVAGSRWISRGW